MVNKRFAFADLIEQVHHATIVNGMLGQQLQATQNPEPVQIHPSASSFGHADKDGNLVLAYTSIHLTYYVASIRSAAQLTLATLYAAKAHWRFTRCSGRNATPNQNSSYNKRT